MNQEESEHNEVDGMKKGVDSKGEVMHISWRFSGPTRATRSPFIPFTVIQLQTFARVLVASANLTLRGSGITVQR